MITEDDGCTVSPTISISCEYCTKNLTNLNINNREKHIASCKKKHPCKRKSKTIHSFFSHGAESKSSRLENDIESVDTIEIIEERDHETEEGVGTTNSLNQYSQLRLIFCVGYLPENYNINTDFPHQVLPSCEFTISKGRFHTSNCAKGNFLVDISVDGNINWGCQNLKNDKSLSKILNTCEVDDPTSHIRDDYLTYNQLKLKLDNVRSKLSLLSIDKYRSDKKNERLGTTLSYHKRLVTMIAENKIVSLHNLVNIALKNNRSIQYILGKYAFFNTLLCFSFFECQRKKLFNSCLYFFQKEGAFLFNISELSIQHSRRKHKIELYQTKCAV